jgi:sarcosine oxidase subunit beta
VLAPELIDPAPNPAPNVPAMERALACARRLIPKLAGASIVRRWAGMVDMSPDGLPIIDAHAGPDGLVLVTGLSGHGLTLGPVLGEITADLAVDGDTARPIQPFRLSRFNEGKVPIPTKMI